MTVPDVVDVHVHFVRTVQQEKVVFPKAGWPDEWYGANPEGFDRWLRSEELSHIFAINFIDTHTIIDNRLARLTPDERPAAEKELAEQMKERTSSFNEWICEYTKTEKRVTPFVNIDIGAFYDDEQMMMDELDKRLAEGAQGVKLHPGLGRFMPGDPRMFPVYERLQSAGIPILSDSGSAGGRTPGSTVYGEPINFYPVFEKFPRLRFIMAHLTTAYWDERIELAKRFPQVQFDISGGFYSPDGPMRARDGNRCVPLADAARFLKTIGTDRCMFATDAPGADVRAYIRIILGLPLTDGEKEQILSKNARDYLGVPKP